MKTLHKCLILLFMVLMSCVIHEQAHVNINRYYGCESVNYIIKTVPHDCYFDNHDDYLSLLESQSNVDAFGYPLQLIFFILLIIWLRNEDDN